uniref:Uncharacterized protein n=1 Tax=Timema bartmani TaxID=61472 RepID=A0A7R9FEH6_9NEOP|nr:unnamed protein product [Timema bartmani]
MAQNSELPVRISYQSLFHSKQLYETVLLCQRILEQKVAIFLGFLTKTKYFHLNKEWLVPPQPRQVNNLSFTFFQRMLVAVKMTLGASLAMEYKYNNLFDILDLFE